jgi:hypothetical protein
MRRAAVICCVAAAIGGAAGYAVGRGEDEVVRETSPPTRRAQLDPCPPSAWAKGGGTDYAVSGISCREVNALVLRDFAPATTTRTGRALMFDGWVCFQQQTGGRYSPVLNVCADGRRRFRFLFH